MPTEPVIEIKGLTKYYGDVVGVKDLDLEVRKGEVFGFLGPNGAGKTTTIRVLMDFIRRSSGDVKLMGLDPETAPDDVQARIGYLPGEVGHYGGMTGRRFLRYLMDLRGIDCWERVEVLAERLDLDMSKRVKDYSKGNKQKLNLVQTFMHEPDLYILDEPTSGLDPLMQQEFYKLVMEEKTKGATVFMSSHVLAEVEHVCDRVGILKDGHMVALESMASLKDKTGKVLDVEFGPGVNVTVDMFDIEGVRGVKVHDHSLRMTVIGKVDPVIKRLAQYDVASMSFQPFSLEHLFLEMYGAEDIDDIKMNGSEENNGSGPNDSKDGLSDRDKGGARL